MPTAASFLPHQTCSHAWGALSIAVRMPPSSSITFIRSSLQSVAKIFPADTKRWPAVVILLDRLG